MDRLHSWGKGSGEEGCTESPLLYSNINPMLPSLKPSQAVLKMVRVVSAKKAPGKAAGPGARGLSRGEALCALELFHSGWDLRSQHW